MIIRAENKFWSDEKGAGIWIEIPESAICHDIWTREPNGARTAEMRTAAHLAFAADESARGPAANVMNLFDFPTPTYDACKASFAADWDAMEAYESFGLATLESEGQ